MKITHIVVGDLAAAALQAGLKDGSHIQDEIFVIKDLFNVGPLRDPEMPFSSLRTRFWAEVMDKESIPEVNDLERLMKLSSQLTNGELDQVWFWMAGLPADICSYFWLLHFLKKHIGKLHVLNIAGLPFLDDEAHLFYPNSISSLPPKQIIKALKLARPITPSEWEIDGDEWKRLIQEEAVGIRTSEGVKKIVGRAIDFYDKDLLALATINNQKIAKLIGNAMQKQSIFTGDLFLIWRLRKMAFNQQVTLFKDSVKLYSDGDNVSTLFENK